MPEPGEKFEWREVHPAPCSEELRDEHLRAFIAAFIEPDRQSRAEHLLLTRKGRARGEFESAISWLRRDRVEVLYGPESWPQGLERRFGQVRGVYIPQYYDAAILTPAEAVCCAALASTSAVLSVESGRLAIVFPEAGPSFLCTA